MSEYSSINIDDKKNIKLKFIAKKNSNINKKLKFVLTKPNHKVEIIIKVLVLENAFVDINALLVVKTGAKNTSSNLKIKCLLVDETSKAKIIPSLEIFENEIKAGHSATISTFLKEHLEYMMSRGISLEIAKKLIINGFLA